MALKSNWLEQQGKARKLLQAKRFNEKFWKKKKIQQNLRCTPKQHTSTP